MMLPRIRRRPPRIHVGPREYRTCSVNATASELLTQNGERFVAFAVRNGRLVAKALELPPDVLCVVRLVDHSNSRGKLCTIGPAFAALGLRGGEDLIGTWDEIEEQVEFELLRHTKRRNSGPQEVDRGGQASDAASAA